MIIAIDGPAGAGKGTVARELARRLGYLFIDTGAMYRAVAWQALRENVSLNDLDRIGQIAANSKIELTGDVDSMRVSINGVDVTSEIRTPEVSQAASIVSAIPAVRRALVAQQRVLGQQGNVVMEGRDIGTAVFPDADLKFYLDASIEERGRRRYQEDLLRGTANKSLEETIAEVAERDLRDSTREDSPLIQAADAIRIDSSHLNVEQVVEQILTRIQLARCAS